MKKLLIAVALTLTITPSVSAQAGTDNCQNIKREIEYYDALINGNALRNGTVFITKLNFRNKRQNVECFSVNHGNKK